MGLVLGLMAAVWALGWVFRVPASVRLVAVGAIWAAVVLLNLILPSGHPLRIATGGRAEVWLVLAGVALLVLGYRAGLARLRARAEPPPPPAPAPGAFSPAELDRYARHILLREIGGPGQRRMKDAIVLVVGAGGLGSPALLYLAAAGVGTIHVVDDDVVDASNLQRQVIHAEDRVGQPKVESAVAAMRALNPHVTVVPHRRRLDGALAAELFPACDLILDGSDNFDTRYAVNAAAVAAGKPLVAAAITQWEGQIALYDAARGTPCYACVFPDRPAPGMVPTCAEVGVAAPLPGILGAMMAMEAVKHLTGAGETLAGRMMIYDGLYAEARVIRTTRNPDCPVCGQLHGSGT